MFLKLRILFTILAAACLAFILPVLTWFGWVGFGVCGLMALLFFGLMLLCKQSQEKNQPSEEPTKEEIEEKNDENQK